MGLSSSTLTSWTDPCSLPEKTVIVRGLKSESASPTDIWIAELKDGETFEGKPINSVVLKLWEERTKVPFMKEILEGLDYEIKVYKQIKRIVDKGVCNSFIRYITSGQCYGHQLTEFPGVNRPNFNRNVSYMIEGYTDRPSINSDDRMDMRMGNFSYKRFTVLCTEPAYGGSFDDYIDKHGFTDTTYSLIFQTLVGCYVMANNGIVHNDIHPGNVLLTDNEPATTVYYVFPSDLVIELSVDKRAKIFDFDRAYSESLGENPILNNELCMSSSQCNRIIPNLDMVKFLCYLITFFAGTEEKKSEITNWLSSERITKGDINTLFKEDGECFLRTVRSGKKVSIPDKEYEKFNTPMQIVEACFGTLKKNGLASAVSLEDIPEGAEVYHVSRRVL
jgi:hypothetical protein